jgi:orotate phosphoribosyltransferase
LTDDELKQALREHAYLEGDFVLRSGKRSRYYLDKYRFETRPDILAALGVRIARVVDQFEPDATRLAGPELGAVALAAAGSLASGLPFLIVRKAAKDYGTSNRVEGAYEEGDSVCLIEDVVTRTRWRAEPSASGRSSAPRTSWLSQKPPQNRMVEPVRCDC